MLVRPGNGALPPGPQGLPLLGNVLQFRHDQLGFLLKLQRAYGRMATVYIGKTPVVLLFRPEHVRYLLTLNPRNFTNREVSGGLIFGNLLVLSLLARSFSAKGAVSLQDFVGDGLLTTDGDFHDSHRRLVQGAFTRRRVENHASLIVQYTREALGRWSGGLEIDLVREIQAVVLRIMAKILLDQDVRDSGIGPIMDGILAEPVGLIEGILNLKLNLPFMPYARRMALLRQADDFIYAIVDRRQAETTDQGDVLSILLQRQEGLTSNGLNRREVRDELVSLLAAGYETTTNTLAWTFYLLAQNPMVLEGVLGEIQSVVGDRDVQPADLNNLDYLDWVVKESMRLYPSAWTQGRQAVEAFDLDGYHFPAGTLFMFSQWVLHRLPDVWGDPDVFRPERWDPAAGEKAVRWAYFPFGDGPRTCLGMPLANLEVRLVLATILQRLLPELVPRQPVEPFPLITLRPKHGLRVRFKPAAAVANRPVRSDGSCPYHEKSTLSTERGHG